jgi:hypothetical protein
MALKMIFCCGCGSPSNLLHNNLWYAGFWKVANPGCASQATTCSESSGSFICPDDQNAQHSWGMLWDCVGAWCFSHPWYSWELWTLLTSVSSSSSPFSWTLIVCRTTWITANTSICGWMVHQQLWTAVIWWRTFSTGKVIFLSHWYIFWNLLLQLPKVTCILDFQRGLVSYPLQMNWQPCAGQTFLFSCWVQELEVWG